ncbi:hypothetical protein [Saccharopolyspora hattusasensis]|uniref:hypothetical protein n=1 Tax=Saccharopolyspora hattusasensis TaxID=1128679 RepID=UPI003D98C323
MNSRTWLATLAFQARQKDWWQRYGKGILKKDFDEYVGLESELLERRSPCFTSLTRWRHMPTSKG